MNVAPGPVDSPFVFEFSDPADADLSWEWDDMHMPFAVTPLGADYVRLIGSGINDHYGATGFPSEFKTEVWNGYAYFALRRNVPDEDRKAHVERYIEMCRQRAEVAARYWTSEALPELQAVYAEIQAVQVDDVADAELAAAWLEVWESARRAWQIHFIAILGPYQVLEDLADLYEKAIPDAAPGEAMKLVQGGSEDLFAVEHEAEALAALAAGLPAIAAAMRAGITARDALAALPDGPRFVAEVDRYLARHGHLGQGFDDFSLASWAEDPTLFLAELAKRMDRTTEPAADRRARLLAESEAIAEKARATLAERADELARFEHLLALAREIGPLTEGHNYWIDRMTQARLRSFAMAVGRRLVREGALADPTDIFFFFRDEVADLIRAPRDVAGLVAERRARHALERSIRPPKNVGRPPEAPIVADRFEATRIESTNEHELRGTGASAGIVRGPARVVLSPEAFGRIQPGDIIVCPSSNPSWVPVFVIAGGLVTNTGGLLSHAAVVAREFGLPAVVGTGDATDRIADGRLVEIDGTLGTVRLL